MGLPSPALGRRRRGAWNQGRKGVQERAPSAPQLQGGWEELAGLSHPVFLGPGPSSGAGLEGDSHRRSLCCERHFLGPVGPFPRAPGPLSDDWAANCPPQHLGQNLHPWQPSEQCAWWWVRETWRALGGKHLRDLGMQAVGAAGVGEEVRLGLFAEQTGV